jgi:hypothetical protein
MEVIDEKNSSKEMSEDSNQISEIKINDNDAEGIIEDD